MAAPSDPSATETRSEDRVASADQLLRKAIQIEDSKVKQGMLSMIARLYPETRSGRTTKYMAEHIDRQRATIAALDNTPENKTYDTSRVESAVAALGEAAKQDNSSRIAAAVPPVKLNNNAFVRTNKDIENQLRLSRSDYRIIQRALNGFRFKADVEDGIFERRSRSVLEKYQLSTGRPKTGYLNAATVAALKAVQPKARAADTAIPAVQPAPAPETKASGVDGTYSVEIRRRPDPKWKHGQDEKTKLLLTVDFRKSRDSFVMLNATDHTGHLKNTPNLRPLLSEDGQLKLSGTVSYLFGKRRTKSA